MIHKPRKRFGQNFLQDLTVIERILNALQLQSNDNVLEIGPGLGALTKPLLKVLDQLIAIEIDRDLYAELQALPAAERMQLINQDALTIDYAGFGAGLRIIGNLPYNISTPLILHLLGYASQIRDMHFMLQKEVVLRLASPPGSKNYGRLSVMVQYHCEVEHLLDVPASAFYPSPKVDSAVVRLRPHRQSPYPAVDMTQFEKLVALSFAMRRKTLANNLKPVLSAEQIRTIGIDPGLRPEQLSVDDFVRLTLHVGEVR